MSRAHADQELEQYRNLLETPTEFKDGFGWTTVAGIFFCGLIMLPGSIYLGLMTGGSLGAAATWVTVILFSEIARRSLKAMNKQELVVLLYAANVMIAANVMFPGGPFGQFIFRAYLVTSDAVRDAGMMDSFPTWFVPKPDSDAILQRNLFHKDWLLPVGLALFMMIAGLLQRYTLGYFFFRVTSDMENLPFPLAPISAQGAMAMAEADEKEVVEEGNGEKKKAAQGDGDESIAATEEIGTRKKRSAKWRLFSLGVSIGIAFGFLKVGIPAITGLILEKPFYLIPQPFVDTTTLTERLLPATPTGVTIDIGIILLGFVLPFWAVVGTFIAIACTLIVNPVLHHFGILQQWQPGMNTINTTFANRIDFWMSFSVGIGLGIAAVSIFQTVRDVRKRMKELKAKRAENPAGQRDNIWETPQLGRGDYPLWIALVVYGTASLAVIIVCHSLVPQIPYAFLFLFAFVYNPLVSYVNARLLGIAGQQVDIPFVRETAFVLSGAKGIDIWLAPIPIQNYGGMAQGFRVNELTGVSFWSLIKAELVALPILFVLSFLFWAFIWHSEAIPSEMFPYAQVQWELQSKTTVLLYSSTFVPPGDDPATKSILDSQFMKAVHPTVIGSGFAFTVIMFAVLNMFGLPVMLIYGFVRGLGQLPHFMALEIVGALLGRFYFRKKFGTKNFLRMAPVLLAGYFTGVGLISMATIAMKLIKEAVSSTPF